MQGRLSHRDVQRVLAHYDVGDAYGVTADGGGTANANFLVRTPARTLFLRRRNPRYTAPDMLEFDHRLQQHLACAGLCTPLAIPTRDGNTWLRLDDSVYELYPYVEGHCHDRQNVAQVADAARHLARFHAATAGFDTRGQKRWPRYDSPSLIREALREAWGLASSDEQRARIGWLCEQTERLANA
ncbi:MAG: phosphotransferase, partial [Armatimonadota bacterium]